jgi:broad specificity phosphatase PhoE
MTSDPNFMENIQDVLFYINRHGTTKLNEEDLYRGWSDDDDAALDARGIRQAEIAGHFFRRLPVKFGYLTSSDLGRATHTAAIIGKILGITDIYADPRLRPLNVGDYTGKSKEKNSVLYYIQNPDVKFPGGESLNEFRKRQADASVGLFAWLQQHPDEKAIEVSHLSNVIYWEDYDEAVTGYLKDYATDKKDLIHPGGVVAVMKDKTVIPLLGENKKAKASDEGDE